MPLRYKYAGVDPGKLVREPINRLAVNINQLEEFRRSGPSRIFVETVIHGPFHNGLANRSSWVQRTVRVLKDDLDPTSMLPQGRFRQFSNFIIIDVNSAAGGIDKPDDASGNGGFTRTGFTDDSKCLSLPNFYVDILSCIDFAGFTKKLFPP